VVQSRSARKIPQGHAQVIQISSGGLLKRLFSINTMSRRPLLNARAMSRMLTKSRFRRLHVILGDANMSEISTYLKIGTTQLVLHDRGPRYH
jgi:hypothetical protein